MDIMTWIFLFGAAIVLGAPLLDAIDIEGKVISADVGLLLNIWFLDHPARPA